MISSLVTQLCLLTYLYFEPKHAIRARWFSWKKTGYMVENPVKLRSLSIRNQRLAIARGLGCWRHCFIYCRECEGLFSVNTPEDYHSRFFQILTVYQKPSCQYKITQIAVFYILLGGPFLYIQFIIQFDMNQSDI